MEARVKPVFQADPSLKSEILKKRLLKSCEEFSSVLISYMMKTMREGVSWGGESGCASEIYQDMLTEQVAKVIARSSELGIGKMLYSQLEHSIRTKAQQKPAESPAEAKTAVSRPSPAKPESGTQKSGVGDKGSDGRSAGLSDIRQPISGISIGGQSFSKRY